MVSIFAKARICRGNTQIHLQFFCKSKLQSTQKDRAATQMDRSSTLSEISFHGLPSKSKHPSIRIQIASSLSTQLLVLVFTKPPSAHRCLANIFRQYFCEFFRKFQQCIKIRSKKFQKVHQKTPVAKSYVSKVEGFHRTNNRMRSVKKVFLERCFQNSQEKVCVRDSILIKFKKIF